jgi:transposase
VSSVVPMGLKVESNTAVEAGIVVVARSEVAERPCPVCGRASRRVHSRYVRTISDLPCGGRRVELRLRARRFVCRTPFCPRRIFAERFEAAVVGERSRRSSRLECIVHHLLFASLIASKISRLGASLSPAGCCAGADRFTY